MKSERQKRIYFTFTFHCDKKKITQTPKIEEGKE